MGRVGRGIEMKSRDLRGGVPFRAPTGAAPSQALTVIVAEDNRLQRVILSRMVESLGYLVLPAEDGQEALDLVRRTDAQIVLSDYQMPELNGIELTRRIRDLDLGHYVHVIMITGREDDAIRSEAFEAGVDDFLAKGQNPVALRARIRSASRLVQHARDLAESNRVLRETHQRLEEDLTAAANAQRQLLPEIHEHIFGFRVASTFVPSSFVSGDMFGCFPLCEGKLAFYAVDVSGHGVHASLLSVAIGHLITPEFFKKRVLADENAPDPAALVADLNRRFSGMDNDEYFTMFCGVVDSRTGQFDYCQAAYPSPQLVTATGDVTIVGDGGFPVGLLPQAEYDNHSMQFAFGNSLVICSDAVTEAENENSIPFGIDRMQSIVSKMPSTGVDKLPATLVNALNVWRGGRTLEDDLTIVALERTRPHDT